MKLSFKRVKEIIAEEIDSLSVIKEGVWNFDIAQQKGPPGAFKHVKATTADIEFEWGKKDRNSTYGMDPYFRWAPTGGGGLFSTLGELQWPGDPFTYEKIEGSSRSNPRVRVVTGPSSKKNLLGKITIIKDKPRIDAWWEGDTILFNDIPIVANAEDQDDPLINITKVAAPDQDKNITVLEKSASVQEIWKALYRATLALESKLKQEWADEGFDYNQEEKRLGDYFSAVADAYHGNPIKQEDPTTQAFKLSAAISELIRYVGPILKSYYFATDQDPYPGLLMGDEVNDLAERVLLRASNLMEKLVLDNGDISNAFLTSSELARIYSGPPDAGTSGMWWHQEEEVEEELEEEFEDSGIYQENFKISSQRLSQIIQEELQLITENQGPQDGSGEEYLGVAARQGSAF